MFLLRESNNRQILTSLAILKIWSARYNELRVNETDFVESISLQKFNDISYKKP